MQNGGLCSLCNSSFLLTILLYLSTGPPWAACEDICSSLVLSSGLRGISALLRDAPPPPPSFSCCRVVSRVLFLAPFSWVAFWPFLTMFSQRRRHLSWRAEPCRLVGLLGTAGNGWNRLHRSWGGLVSPLLQSPLPAQGHPHPKQSVMGSFPSFLLGRTVPNPFQIFLKNGTNRYSLCSLIHTEYIILMWVSTRRTHWN